MFGLIGLIWGGLLFFGFGPFTFFYEDGDVSNYFVDWFCIFVLFISAAQSGNGQNTGRNSLLAFIGGILAGRSKWFN